MSLSLSISERSDPVVMCYEKKFSKRVKFYGLVRYFIPLINRHQSNFDSINEQNFVHDNDPYPMHNTV